jgi:hypothetical protein
MQKQLFKKKNKAQPESLRIFGRIDAVIIIFLFIVCVLTLPTLHSMLPDKVVIYKENVIAATYPLDTDREITVKGALGPLTFAIQNHTVSVIRSDCPYGICRKTGSIGKPNAQIVCAPNHIVITITSTMKDTVDGVAR